MSAKQATDNVLDGIAGQLGVGKRPNDTTFVQNMFVAGATQLCHDQWLYVTSDKFILQAVAGTMLEFVDELPPLRQPRRLQFTDFESDVI